MWVSHLSYQPIVHNNFFDPTTWRELYEHVTRQPMLYGAKSNGQTDPHGHWSWKPIYDEQQNLAAMILPAELDRIWRVVRERIYPNEQRVVLRSYANGYTYGTDGYFHFDSQRVDEDTIIVYVVQSWKPDWAGETVFLNEANGQTFSVLPAPNRLVVGPSNMLHCARAVSRQCVLLRRTLMFKTRKLRSFHWENLSTFLVRRGALAHKHQRGSLHDHLMRVYDLMFARQCPLAACNGGALHSIYGTNAFRHRIVEPTPDNRALVAGMFGRDAEALAYAFSLLDRPSVLELHANDSVDMLDTMTVKMPLTVTAPQKEHLCLIEAANLLDQGQLDKHPVLKAKWEAK